MKGLKKHPIQLMQVQIHELSFKINKVIKETSIDETPAFKLGFGHDILDEGKIVAVGLKAKTENIKKAKYAITVELVGVFSVGKGFNVEMLPDWAKKNAPFILMPYLREHIYGLSLRAGILPVHMPLVEIPQNSHTNEECRESSTQADD